MVWTESKQSLLAWSARNLYAREAATVNATALTVTFHAIGIQNIGVYQKLYTHA